MNFDRAWEMFDEMRKDGHQASLATYNSLLFVVGNIAVPDPWNRAMSLVQQMNQEPVVRPNISEHPSPSLITLSSPSPPASTPSQPQ
jgi:hypothetical protein